MFHQTGGKYDPRTMRGRVGSFFFTFLFKLLFSDSGKTPWRGGVPLRWTPMEWWFRWVFFYFFFILVQTIKGKWGWCQASCYDEQLLDGHEYCGNHSKCVNNDDDTRGLTCECDSGYTAHKMHFGMESYQEYIQIFYEQGVETKTNALRVDTSVLHQHWHMWIASTLMVVIIVKSPQVGLILEKTT